MKNISYFDFGFFGSRESAKMYDFFFFFTAALFIFRFLSWKILHQALIYFKATFRLNYLMWDMNGYLHSGSSNPGA